MYRSKIKQALFAPFLLLILFSCTVQLLSPIFITQKAQAAPVPSTAEIQWESINNLKYEDKNYVYSGSVQSIQVGSTTTSVGPATTTVSTAIFTEEGQTGCYSGYIINVKGTETTVQKQQPGTASGTSGTCTKTNVATPTSPIDIKYRYANLLWQDKNTITRIDSKSDSYGNKNDNLGALTFKREGTSNNFSEEGGTCGDVISLTSSDMSEATYTVQSTKKNDKQDVAYDSNGKLIQDKSTELISGSSPACYKSANPVRITLAYASAASAEEGAGRNDSSGSASSQNSSSSGDHESNCRASLSPFGWVMCPIVWIADQLYTRFVGWVNQILYFESNLYDTAQIKEIWRSFVVIANSVIVLLALVMIVSQIFSFEFFSAYSVKKILPRLIAGAIFVQLSWVICTTMIDITNAVGSGLYWLLLSPFDKYNDIGSFVTMRDVFRFYSYDASTALEMGVSGGVGVLGYLIGAAALSSILAPGVGWTLAIASVGVIIGVVIAVFTLIIRQSLLIVLLVMAPIGFTFWVLPGTKKLWDMWWGSFSKLLMMYPLIMLLFAGGTIAATILASTNDKMSDIFAVIAFFGPMFLVGATFKFAGVALGAVAGYAVGAGKKLSGNSFGMQRKREIATKAKADIKAKELADKQQERGAKMFNPNANLLNKTRARAAVGGTALFMPFTKRGQRKYDAYSQRFVAGNDEHEMSRAKEQWEAVRQEAGLDKSEMKDFQKDVARAMARGDKTAQLTRVAKDANGNTIYENGKEKREVVLNKDGTARAQIDVNDYMFRTAANSSGDYGDLSDFYGEAQNAAYEKDGGKEGARSTLISALTSKSLNKDGNLGKASYHTTNHKDIMSDDARDIRGKLVEGINSLTGNYRDFESGEVKFKSNGATGVYGNQVALARAIRKDASLEIDRNAAPEQIRITEQIRNAALSDMASAVKNAQSNSLREMLIQEMGSNDAEREAIRSVMDSGGTTALRYGADGKSIIAVNTGTGQAMNFGGGGQTGSSGGGGTTN